MRILGIHVPWTSDDKPKQVLTAVSNSDVRQKQSSTTVQPQPDSPNKSGTSSALNSPTRIITGAEAARIRAMQEEADAAVVDLLNRLNKQEGETSGLHDTSLEVKGYLADTQEETAPGDSSLKKNKKGAGSKDQIPKPPPKPASEAAQAALQKILYRKPKG